MRSQNKAGSTKLSTSRQPGTSPRPRAAAGRASTGTSRRRDAATGAATARHRASTAAGHLGQGYLLQGFIERGGGGDGIGDWGQDRGVIGDGFQRSAFPFQRFSVQRTKPGRAIIAQAEKTLFKLFQPFSHAQSFHDLGNVGRRQRDCPAPPRWRYRVPAGHVPHGERVRVRRGRPRAPSQAVRCCRGAVRRSAAHAEPLLRRRNAAVRGRELGRLARGRGGYTQ